MAPFVTIVVPVRNEERYLGATLRSLLTQRYDAARFEVIVADGQSTDNTIDVVRRLQTVYDNLHLLFNPRRLSSAARNLGARHARGDYVLIVDGHCELRTADYLQRLVEVFEQHGVDCVGRPQPLDVTGASPWQLAIALARSSPLGHNPGSFIYADEGGEVPPQSVAIAYRRNVFASVGYFDESFDACEDVEFNHRIAAAGMRCYFDPRLAVYYHPRASLSGLAFQMLRYGRGRARLMLKHDDTVSLGPLIPAGFLVGLGASFVLGLVSPVFAGLFCIAALVYSVAVVAGGTAVAVQRRASQLTPLMPLVFLAIHVAAGWGVLSELMAGLIRRVFRRFRPHLRGLGGAG